MRRPRGASNFPSRIGVSVSDADHQRPGKRQCGRCRHEAIEAWRFAVDKSIVLAQLPVDFWETVEDRQIDSENNNRLGQRHQRGEPRRSSVPDQRWLAPHGAMRNAGACRRSHCSSIISIHTISP